MSTGTVKWFDAGKGYGFITPEDGGKDLFVHHSEIQTDGYATLNDGQQVEYEVGQGQKGPCGQPVFKASRAYSYLSMSLVLASDRSRLPASQVS